MLELLVRYMYSGQVSVTEEQLVPLVQAAKTLGIKGLVDVPVEDRVRETQQQEQEQPAPVQSPPPPRRGCLKVKSASSLLSPVLRPVSRIGEVEVFPAPDTGTNGDMDTADIKEEETGDTSTADTEQSVSIFINMCDCVHDVQCAMGVELLYFVAAVAATDERGDGHLLPARRGPAARAADLLVRALRQGVHFQTEKPETRAQRALRLQPRAVPLLQQGPPGQLQPEAARVPGAQHEGESYLELQTIHRMSQSQIWVQTDRC